MQKGLNRNKNKNSTMEKIHKILILLSFFIVLAIILSSFSINTSLRIYDKLDSKLGNLNTETKLINQKLDSINNSLWLESEKHFLEVMNKIDNSVVEIRVYPAQKNSGNLNAVIYTDCQGRDWSIGTGFSINSDGHILTAKHVIKGAEIILISLKNGTLMEVGGGITSGYADVAILHVKSGLPPVKFIEEGLLELGSNIGFIGFPLGPNVRTKTRGSISSVVPYRYEGDNLDTIVYIINSFVNKGNSGGPIFSLKTGEVIGIMNARNEEMSGIAISTALNKKGLSEVVY